MTPKEAQINDRYKGNSYAAIVQYPERIAPVADHNKIGYQRIIALVKGSGATVLQEYSGINETALTVLMFSANHMSRGVKFGDLSKLLS